MNRVYCLYRVSDRGQVEKNDIPMQRIACRTFAQERGWEIEKELSEKGISGYKLTMQQRDAILEIREAALAGKFDILLVYMFDRIGRRDKRLAATKAFILNVCFKRLCQFFPLIADASR